MDQSITVQIAGKTYPLKAQSPEVERCMRLAAESVNSMLAQFNERFPGKPVEDKLVFVAIQQAVGKIMAQGQLAALNADVASLKNELSDYLSQVEK